jgi:hypothetical protein
MASKRDRNPVEKHQFERESSFLLQSFVVWILMFSSVLVLWLAAFLAFDLLLIGFDLSWAVSSGIAFVAAGIVGTLFLLLIRSKLTR